MTDDPSFPQLSNGVRASDLRELAKIVNHEIFRARAGIGPTGKMPTQEKAVRIANLQGIEARLRNEIQWAEATRIPWDRIRAEFPAVMAVLADQIAVTNDSLATSELFRRMRSLAARLEAARQPE